MGRYPNIMRTSVELKEGALGCLASARLLLGIAKLRVGMVQSQYPALLNPALEDMDRIERLIRDSQGYIASTLPTSRASEV